MEAEKDCRLDEALVLYDAARREAEAGLDCARRHARLVPAEANRAAYMAAINLDELGRALVTYNGIISGRFTTVRSTLTGIAAAYCAELEELDRAAILGGLKKEQTDLFDYYRGNALVGVNSLDAGIKYLDRFIAQGEGGEDFLVQAASIKKGALKDLSGARTKADCPVLDKQLTGAPLELKDAYPACTLPAPPPALPSVHSFSFVTGLGYDDNIMKVSRGMVRPSDAIDKGSLFYEADFVASGKRFTDVRCDPLRGAEALLADILSVGYSAAIGYDEHDRLDPLVQVAMASYLRAVTSR